MKGAKTKKTMPSSAYDLELGRVVKEISRAKARTVLIQLPDGLKPRAKEIQEAITRAADVNVLIWAGSCFGACDVPNVKGFGIDLLVQWGHAQWKAD